jgi:hypothetical protein
MILWRRHLYSMAAVSLVRRAMNRSKGRRETAFPRLRATAFVHSLPRPHRWYAIDRAGSTSRPRAMMGASLARTASSRGSALAASAFQPSVKAHVTIRYSTPRGPGRLENRRPPQPRGAASQVVICGERGMLSPRSPTRLKGWGGVGSSLCRTVQGQVARVGE